MQGCGGVGGAERLYVYQKMENPEVYHSLHIHGQLVYNKGANGIQCGRR